MHNLDERTTRAAGRAQGADNVNSPAVLIPVKDLRDVKLRLADLLDARERAELVLAMLGDLLETLRGAGFSSTVLSPDPQVLTFAEGAGARPLPEHPRAGSLNEALASAVACHLGDATSLLVILADTPLASPTEICALVEQA